ncbi:glycine/D-amino acid oxidase-like deaminating enzyme [Litoreibacter halocynthiae]|uniref:Glycine/D-amino acid oxidase-like deaminating enzyme n=1 Tax=Litoreibacter halocynthiae TaxID=1242689 RepID=A0A4R7LF99_9RHOB|nr:FAD-binding oxidoreductase [Litoreibacter halocynthiae]TDT73819.1 glycine/D-amino acid oxidase-like deaminating enzyme [Litoreibacter halocynthiae]
MQAPKRTSYDVVIVGGAIYGSSVAWWLSRNPDFGGSILVVERDPTYEFASTSHTNSCIRQQFSAEVNIKISQFGAEFIHGFQEFMQDDAAPRIVLQSYGYMYLADNEVFAQTLRESQQIQQRLGAGTKFMAVDEIKAAYPFYNLDGIIGGNHNLINEGYFDGGTIFDWWKRKARAQGAEYVHNEVCGITRNSAGDRVKSVTLASGETISCGTLVNCSGPRAALTAQMAGLDIPVEPRKRYTFIFDAETPLDRDLPLTIDPSGVHMRSDGKYYMAGCPPDDDPAVAYDDFVEDHSIWENKVWPAAATRVPAFETAKLVNSWVGHYAYNAFDQNAIVGPSPELENFLFVNGFSGHGLQQSPAIGRGVAEWITYGEYRSLDLSPFGVERIIARESFVERAVI